MQGSRGDSPSSSLAPRVFFTLFPFRSRVFGAPFLGYAKPARRVGNQVGLSCLTLPEDAFSGLTRHACGATRARVREQPAVHVHAATNHYCNVTRAFF